MMSMPQMTFSVNCLACGAELNFDPSLGKLHCEYCDSEFTSQEIEEYYKNKEEKTSEDTGSTSTNGGDEWGEDGQNMRAYSCSTCGAELIADENTAASMCPYCGNNTIVAANFTGALRPNYVIPFGFAKNQAISKYKDYYKSKKLLPKSFEQTNHIEDIQGVYVPFRLYAGSASVSAKYEAADVTENQTEIISKIYDVRREGEMSFEKVPADASERMPDDLMDSIEPYKFEELREFSMAYLPGFLAEKCSTEESSDRTRAQQRIENTAKSRVRSTVHHDRITRDNVNVRVNFSNTEYGLLPVWYLVTKYNDKLYRFAMNGQTGEFIGDLPIDSGKMAVRVIIAAVVAAIVAYLLIGDITLVILAALAAGGISGAIGYASMKPVAKASRADSYIKDDLRLTLQNDTYIRTETKKKQTN